MRVVFRSEYPFHMHYGKVIAIEDRESLGSHKSEHVEILWEGDQYFPKYANTKTWVPTWNNRLEIAE